MLLNQCVGCMSEKNLVVIDLILNSPVLESLHTIQITIPPFCWIMICCMQAQVVIIYEIMSYVMHNYCTTVSESVQLYKAKMQKMHANGFLSDNQKKSQDFFLLNNFYNQCLCVIYENIRKNWYKRLPLKKSNCEGYENGNQRLRNVKN